MTFKCILDLEVCLILSCLGAISKPYQKYKNKGRFHAQKEYENMVGAVLALVLNNTVQSTSFWKNLS